MNERMKKQARKKPSARTLAAVKKGMVKADSAFPPSLPRTANLIVIAVIFIWAFLLYGNTLLNKYSIDDNLVTHSDVVRQGYKAIPFILSSYLADDGNGTESRSGSYRPLSGSSFAMEYSLWGEKPSKSHLINVFLYFIASLITFYVLRRLLINYNILFPVLITMLFMAHPVHTEVVASLKNRDELFAYIFGMAGMYTLLSYTYSRRFSYIILTCLLLVLACISQVSALPFIGLYILVMYFFSNMKQRDIFIAACMFVISALAAFLVPRIFLPHPASMHYYFDNALFFEKNIWIRLGTSMISLLFYLKILVYPHPLLYYYGYNMIRLAALANPLVLLSVMIYTLLLGYALIRIRSKTFLSFAILWYLVSIIIYSNLFFPVPGIVAERSVFLASLGFMMILVLMIFRLGKTEPNSLTIEFDARFRIIVMAVAILIPYGLLTINRNAKWRDSGSVFANDIPKLEKSAKANYQYAGYLLTNLYKDEDFTRYGLSTESSREAIKKHLRLSLKVYPLSCNTLNDMGTVFLNIEKSYDSALYYFQKAVAVDPLYIPAWANMGMANHQMGKYFIAISCYQKILEIQPGDSGASYAIAELYSELGDVTKSLYYRRLGQKTAAKKGSPSF